MRFLMFARNKRTTRRAKEVSLSGSTGFCSKLTNVVTGKSPVVYVKYGGTNTGAEKEMATPNHVHAITPEDSIILTSLDEQSVMANSTEHAYPVQNCYPVPGVQPGYISRDVPDSALFLPLHNSVHTSPVHYSAWEVPMFHHYTQFSTGYSTISAHKAFRCLR